MKKTTHRSKSKLLVAAYLPAGEAYPVLLILIEFEDGTPSWTSPVVRRSEPQAYSALYRACKGSPRWLYGQQPQALLANYAK